MSVSKYFSKEEALAVHQLTARLPQADLSLQNLWQLMDQIWDEMGCDNTALDTEKVANYYNHPVWLLNGLFIESHDTSLQHRASISDWIAQKQIARVLEFGGGFGTLARMISDKSANTIIDIYEPFPASAAVRCCQDYENISFVNQFRHKYDCLVSTDVLEHVPDPLSLLAKMVELVHINGYLIIANHFYPSIKCHLPETFHLRFSFDRFAVVMGLEVLGLCNGSHATIYVKTSECSLNWRKIRRMESRSKLFFAWKEFDRKHIWPWKIRVKKLIRDSKVAFQKAIKH
ncbi:class I SAM-dependent methyltransferase [Nodosilinea sp. PGN35]|uniref:class I SAM-dependent methyltransferase n=1 Tax=Nodosilinea sp. PGN35 TaxID=3020489 RepID=UPI0023B23FDA|nr:methyltransferase domain-containing protein [Nodosilinea sp. TSF1-S3]MDF0368160.1 methyltransferase domain-containing protein [Nodosilinea sp. TSF1-S3]